MKLTLLFQVVVFLTLSLSSRAFLGLDWKALVPKTIQKHTSETRERTPRFFFKNASTVLPKPEAPFQSNTIAKEEESLSSQQHQRYEDPKAMPWKTSIAPYTHHEKDTLLFMPYYEAHLSAMKSRLTNLRQIPLPPTHHYNENVPNQPGKPGANKATRVSNVEYTSDEYRKIRLTYYDAGDSIQVFNSLWYPNPSLGNIPLLGVDLLAFGRKKYLVAVEYQPVAKYGLVDTDDSKECSHFEPFDFGHGHKWQSLLEPIYNNLPEEFRGCKTDRFFEGTDFFSDVMLFGRLERDQEDLIHEGGDLWEAFHSYTESHIDIVQTQMNNLESLGLSSLSSSSSSSSSLPLSRDRQPPNNGKVNGDKLSQDILRDVETLVLKGQKDHDVYMASRDPAHALFSKNFGTDWADSFLYDFLFDLANGTEDEKKQ
jgi:15,16-dihydrobiliverdin:ferredoxin oxidoreductase